MKRLVITLFVLVLTAGQTSSLLHAQAGADILETKVICREENRYIGWPTIEKTDDGGLIVVFSGDRDEHVCPWGKTEMVTSTDNGKTWSEPSIINNTPLDDRDAGVIQTSEGTIIVSWFTSDAFMYERYQRHYSPEVVAGWQRHIGKISDETHDRWLGQWVRRSEDGGETWGDYIETTVNAPHGPIELSDGRLLYVGRTLWADEPELLAMESTDDGKSWQRLGTIDLAPQDSIKYAHELHAVEVSPGRILAMIRYQPPGYDNRVMRQCISTDGGETWTTPVPTGIVGYPPHLIKHSSGKLICVYGYRQEPFGERAVVSHDGGETWDIDHIMELAPAPNGDLGYPASVELDDGSIYTVYYQQEEDGGKTVLMGTHWRLMD